MVILTSIFKKGLLFSYYFSTRALANRINYFWQQMKKNRANNLSRISIYTQNNPHMDPPKTMSRAAISSFIKNSRIHK